MEHVRNWLLPIILGAGWIAALPFLAKSPELLMSDEELVAAIAGSVVATIALGFRRRAPLTTLGVTTAMVVIGHIATPPLGLAVLPVEVVALYSVGVRCTTAVSWRAAGVLVAVQTLTAVIVYGPGLEAVGETAANLIGYGIILGGGQNRRRRLAARGSDLQQLRAADARRLVAAAAERRRLARELHDVSAHHLTSIVVSGTAAERLADSRPELAAEALSYAATTGRETLRSLHQLVAMLETGGREQSEPLSIRIAGLADAFTRLGQQVVVDVTPDLPGPVAEAVFGIVRESLTNTLRHAPGAAVRVLVVQAGDSVDVLVENGQATGTATSGQGGQRGVAGMRDRAQAVGGTLTAGPGPDGGWQVRATLPLAAAAPLPAGAAAALPVGPAAALPVGAAATSPRSGVRWQERWFADSGILLVVLLPAVGGTIGLISEEPGLDAATISLAILLALIPGLILLGRRDRPWTVVAGVALSGFLWPLALALDWLPDAFESALAFSVLAPAAAVYSLALYGGNPAVTALSMLASGGSFGLAVAALMMHTPAEDEDPAFAFAVGGLIAFILVILLLACWATGVLIRQRRNQRRDHTGETLARLVWATEMEVHTERQRIAAGLHYSVLTRTHTMITLAEAGRLSDVTAEARSALTAMRELLATLDEDGTPAPRTPAEKELS
ncbi:histidine kinase [Kribbella sp. NPDC056951]|uniref:histidine kinase n=1 Tax=Kribbella sp. NPDC056951 TaxID=3345978 RepID=UPI00362A4A5A